MSWHRSGVIQTNVGSVPAATSSAICSNGTTLLHRSGLVTMSVKYRKGLCRFAYSSVSGPV
jgi:hypothetical protein